MTTTLFTRTLLKGMADGMSDAGRMPPFAHDDIAIGVFDKIASDMGLPAVLEAPLSDEMYIKIGQWLINSAEEAVRQGHGPSATLQAMAKQAAHIPMEERAMKIAAYMMAKTAEDASLNGTGSNTPESATQTNAVAALDQKNRSSLQYLVGMGKTDMPEGGVVGRQMPHPMAPQGPAINNSLTHLDKQAQEKVARAAVFVEGLANRSAEVTPKLVLASAALAEGGTAGLEVMAHIVQNVKTAEELDGMLDHVMGAQQAHGAEPDPALVAAIEQVLMEHGLLGGGDEEGAPSAGPEGIDADDASDPKVAAAKTVLAGIADIPMPKTEDIHKSRAAHHAENVAKKVKEHLSDPKKRGNLARGAGTAAALAGVAAAGYGTGKYLRKKHDEKKDKEEKATASKEAQLLAVLKAAADGSLNEVGENTPESAAKDNANAKLDEENRAKNEYLKGNGKTDMPNVGHVGASMDAPKGPEKLNPDTTPARETKSASYLDTLSAMAMEWGGKLPATLSATEKRAHVMALAGMPEELRQGYVQTLLGR